MARFGNIGTQYFDNAGDPLIFGKLYFFESGTSIDKDTFADVNLSILNQNPVLLSAAGRQPNIFFEGSARVVLTNSSDVQIEERDPIGAEIDEGAFSSWNSLTIYDLGDIVVGPDGRYYQSIATNNQGNVPADGSAAWSHIQFLTTWNANQTYALHASVVASDGRIYLSAINNNLNNDPVTDAVNWQYATPAVDPDGVVFSASKVYAFRSL